MKNYEYVFFDFDGTLVDTTNGTKLSALYALKQFGIDESSDIELGRKFSGIILKDKFQEYGLTEQEALKAVDFYREYQSKYTITCNEIYEGIEEATSDSTRIKKNDIMEYAIKNFSNIDFNKCIMIGDRPTDVKAGIENHMDTIGVLYGMGDKDSFNGLDVTYFIEKPKEILNIIK